MRAAGLGGWEWLILCLCCGGGLTTVIIAIAAGVFLFVRRPDNAPNKNE